MKYFVDTNIFLRTLVKDNATSYKACVEFLGKVKSNTLPAVTNSLVLSEVVWTLTSYYKQPKQTVIQASRSILQLHNLNIIEGSNQELALSLYEENKVKYIDACIASIRQVQNGDWTVVSYDKDFDKLKVNRVEPHQL